MVIELNEEEIERLFKQEPSSEKDGGWQGLLVGLQHKLDRSTRMLELSDADLERIHRYAFDYGNGGWEDTLLAIFPRTLGPKLDGTTA